MSDDTKADVKAVMTAFEAFKETNDQRLTQLEKKGASDPITETKLAKIETALVAHEDANQKVTLAQKAAQKATEEVAELTKVIAKLEAKIGRPGVGSDKETKDRAKVEYASAFETYLRKTAEGLSPEEHKLLTEYKVTMAGNDSLGGYYLSPAEMAADIIKNVVLQSPIRSLARVSTLGGPSIKLPKRTGTFAAVRVSELGTRNETTGYTTGMTEIFAPELYAEVRISEQMIEDSMFDIESEMMMEFAEQFAVKEGAEFVSGTGASLQAEGFLTNASVTSTNSGSAATIADVDGQANGLITLFYSGLKTAYAKNATWTFNRKTLGSIRKLKDSQKQYIWVPGVAGSVANTILGTGYVEVPDMPDEGANTYPIAVGDFSKAYRIADRVLISVLRDPFTVSNAGQVLFRARKRVGGAVVQAEAITKLRCAA